MHHTYGSSPIQPKHAILRDRLYVPAEYVTAAHLEAYEHQLEIGKDPLTDDPIYEKYSFYDLISSGDKMYYVFTRGDIPKLRRIFFDFHIYDQRLEVPMKNRLLMKFPAGMKYRPYQLPLIDTFQELTYGIAKAPPRAGKTVCMASTICLDAQKTIVLAHQTDLLVQMYETLEKFTNLKDIRTAENPVVGFPEDVEDFTKLDVCLCTKQTFDHIQNKELGRYVQKMFGSVMVDECFPYYQNVITSKGPRKIGAIYNSWKKGEEIKVLSYSEKDKTFSYKRVTHAWRRDPKDTLTQVKAGGFSIKSTDDHLYLTQQGWVKACELTPEHYLVGYNNGEASSNATLPMSSGDHLSFVLGSFLGDGSLTKHQQGYRLRLIQGAEQEEYLRWKAGLINSEVEFIEKNGFAQKPAYRTASKLFYLPFQMPETKQTKISKDILALVDIKALALWYMDDGSFSKESGVKLHTESFDLPSVESMVEMLKFKFNIEAQVYTHHRKGKIKPYHIIKIPIRECRKFMSLIAPFCRKSLAYKFYEEFAEVLETGSWDFGCLNYYTKVSEVKSVKVTVKDHTAFLFDIEVEDNHTFVVGFNQGVVVHNCHYIPGPVYSQFVNRFDAKYRRGVTATPARKDGLHFILNEVLGPVTFDLPRSEVGYVPMEVMGIKTSVKAKAKKYATIITELCENDVRNNLIAAWVKKDTSEGRTIFAATDRKEHTTSLANKLKDMGISAQAFNGRFTQKSTRKNILDDVRNGRTQVLVAMRQMATGLDIPRADTFYNLTPSSNAVSEGEDLGEGGYEQQCTRILTPFEGKTVAIVRDFVDDMGLAWGAWNIRKHTYNKLEAKIRFAKDDELGKDQPASTAPIYYDTTGMSYDSL